MLKLHNIVKNYDSGENTVHALKGVSIHFRPSEFVCILGHSGCGKTTLLNIIGGLDQYTSGDLVIRGKSTREFKSRDWDTYRNHSCGFVFQSYNLIPHQTVLANVELALTLSGVGKAERRRRAIEALEKVGLGSQLKKKPNQLSGGQMQRVAIARALVNDPEILLADEPTGALDTETSQQIMELLKEVAADRLVVMVTHNPELADQYATRIVRLQDGLIVADSNPYDGKLAVAADSDTNKGKKKHTSMSAMTAFRLSLNNLMTKKGRTMMTAFAGSIGIIGIALILSLSNGIQNYINQVERDTLSSYPVTLQSSTLDMTAMMESASTTGETQPLEEDHIYSSPVMTGMMDMMFSGNKENDLAAFKAFIDSGESGLEDLTTDIAYTYETTLNVYRTDAAGGITQVNPNQVFKTMGMTGEGMMASTMSSNYDVWEQLTGDEALWEAQLEVLAGHLPQNWNEVVLIVDENNRITDFTLYALGVLDSNELAEAIQAKAAGEDVTIDDSVKSYTYDDFLGMTFQLLPTTAYYTVENGIWVDHSTDTAYLAGALADASEISVVGIVRPAEGVSSGFSYGTIGYTRDLMLELLDQVNSSDVVAAQLAEPDTDIFTGLPFELDEMPAYTMDDVNAYIAALPQEQQTQATANLQAMVQAGMPEADIIAAFASQMTGGVSTSTYDLNLQLLGVADPDDPASILLYPKDFESKEEIEQIITDYNEGKEESQQLTYTDMVGLMMSSITTIISAISYVLIAFVGISLVVSSIMIGIITYISVLERTKEIGILRAIGASKGDITRVFNAETLIIGASAGLLGIGVTVLLCFPITSLVQNIAGINATASLPPVAGLILVLISMFLTFIAGLIPAFSAAKKDPVIALRTE